MTKRTFDIVVGFVVASACAPVIVVLAFGTAMSLRAWPFFVQRRVGRGNRDFRIVKIRTLPRSAPAYADKYTIAAVDTTRYCRLLRHLHLDELPQLFLVPGGRMSLVGPRPEMRHLHEQLEPTFAAVRTSVRPGCSGLWQVGRETGHLIGEGPAYDLVYVANASVRLDLWVLWRTVCTMLHLGQPRTIGDIPAWALRRHVRRGEVIDLRPAQSIDPAESDVVADLRNP